MNQSEIPADIINSFFSDGYIDKVECSRANREWNFHLVKHTIVPQYIYLDFCNRVRLAFSHIAEIHFALHYTDDISDRIIIDEYWDAMIEWLHGKVASVNGWLKSAKPEIEGMTIKLQMLDQISLDLARKKQIDRYIRQYFMEGFDRTYTVLFELSTADSNTQAYARFAEQIGQEERTAVQQMTAICPDVSDSRDIQAAAKLVYGYDIKDQPIPLKDIKEEEKKVTIQGVIFGLDVKPLRNGSTLYQYNVTDYSDSMMLKSFVKNKEDLQVFSQLRNGKWIKARGKVEYDRFLQIPELTMIPSDLTEIKSPVNRMDTAVEKRVEFHLHTTMSAMDAVTPVEAYIKQAASWGHKAIAITDHAGVQSFPEASKAAKANGIKVIYGVEANVINDSVPIVVRPRDLELAEASYIVFDIETTGLSVVHNKIIEIAGVKLQNGQVTERFSEFVDPHEPIPYHITQLTNITDDMVRGAKNLQEVLPAFWEFVQDHVIVAHNAQFDMGFIDAACKQLGLAGLDNPVLDTLEFARMIYPNMKNHRLNTLSDKFQISLDNHHRAVDDAAALGGILQGLLKEAAERGITNLNRLNDFVGQELKTARPFHCCIYALNDVGKVNLYKLISLSHTQYFNRVACIPKSKLAEMREGLLIALGCVKGEFFETVLNKPREDAQRVAEFYDVLEIQPIDNNMHLVEKGFVGSRQELEQAVKTVCEIGAQMNKPVIATGNAHYLEPHEKMYREITIHGITGFSPLKDIRKPDVHFRTTEEMLEQFSFLDKKLAYKVVVTNTSELADQFEPFELIPDKRFFPKMDNADEEIREKCFKRALELYGNPIPEHLVKQMEKELTPIIKFGFPTLYLISELLVKKSNEDGYIVGSRGSVGSSVIAMLLGISEVNPLKPHYLCHACQYSEWFTDGTVGSGFDLPDKLCPKCDGPMKGDGHDIPFETFLGFKGDKVPDIDLNFSGEYQAHAHNYTKVLFGEKNVFRAGTIGTIAQKTGFGYAKKYEEDHHQKWRNAELSRLAEGCTGVRRSTGQHAGAIVVVPEGIDVELITPVQFPADDTKAEWQTTHFDFHSFDEVLLKLDILGHDNPTMMRMLHDLTGVNPTEIPMNDQKVMSLFHSTEALGVTNKQLKSTVATYGLPEMGTKFVRQMLEETHPTTFADLLQISGLSHGTGVWLSNAQELIRNHTCTIKTVIGCRDEIMLYLIDKAGMDAALAFAITESVRRGRGLTDEWIEAMKAHKVPKWYIDSCLKIEYMFPKAHAAAYVLAAVRTAYYKLHHPLAFYATYFSVRPDEFEPDLFCRGYKSIEQKYIEIEALNFKASTKEKNMLPTLEMGLEMTARGFSFKSIDLYNSDAAKFVISGDSLIPPFAVVAGVGDNAAKNIAAAREDGDYLSIEDFQQRSKASKTVVDVLSELGCFRGLPESNQLSLF
jgi:DNA polymerase-3 subunit alpha (Gram-positive type)